jgi:glycosyltransferase involved in cell wall biosynthesis
VTFLGPRPHEHIASYMLAANVLVLPSRSEGRGLVLLEAMEAGLPVIASDIPGPREVVRPGETGMLFPTGKADALADCLQRLVENPALGPTLGAGGKEFVRREKLTPSECARLHIQLYQSLASGR